MAIVVKNLVKTFDGIKALNGVSFRVKRGEIFGFLGPNGAGKTTTIKILTTLMKPTEGEAYVAGYDVVEDAVEVRKRIGIVFQDCSVDKYLSGWENLYIHGLIYGLKGDLLRKRIEESLKFIGLIEFKDVEVRKYSGGMMRRLEIARALMHKPEILFLDEPTLGLDPQTRAKIWEFIESLRGDVTVFLTTHYIDEAENCDRIAIIDHGEIVAIGKPEDLKRRIGGDLIYVKPNDYRLAKAINADVKITRDYVIINVNDASKILPEIFEIANSVGVRIEEIKYTRPTLNDVFLYYTGREIRDA